MPATTVNFAGLDFATWGGGWPPDTVGDVSETHYVQAVNTSIGIWAKTGGAPLAAFTFASLWSGAGTGTPCDTSHNGDPTVIYDQMAKRWIVADFSWTNIQNGPYYECIAVSKNSNPVTGGWWLYAYRADDIAHPWLPDYPKMGIWPDGLYMTTNMFDCLNAGCSSASYKEVRVYAFDRADMYAGAPLSSIIVDLNTTLYFSLLPSNLRGAPPPAGRENLLVAESDTAFAFNVWKFHVDWVTPTSSTFNGPNCRQPGELQPARERASADGRHARLPRRPDADAEPSTATSVAPSRCGSTTPFAPEELDRRTGSSGRRSTSPAARSRRRRCSSRSTATSAETAITAGWAASPWTGRATWRWATAWPARPSSRQFATTAGSPAIHSTRCRRARRRSRRAAAPRSEASAVGATTAR